MNKNIYLLVGHYESDPYEPTGTDIYGAFSNPEEIAIAFFHFFDKAKESFLDYFKEWDENNYWKDYPPLTFKTNEFIKEVLNIFDLFKFSNDPVADYNNLRQLIQAYDNKTKQLFNELEKLNKKYWDLGCQAKFFHIEDYFFPVDELQIVTLEQNKLVIYSQSYSE